MKYLSIIFINIFLLNNIAFSQICTGRQDQYDAQFSYIPGETTGRLVLKDLTQVIDSRYFVVTLGCMLQINNKTSCMHVDRKMDNTFIVTTQEILSNSRRNFAKLEFILNHGIKTINLECEHIINH